MRTSHEGSKLKNQTKRLEITTAYMCLIPSIIGLVFLTYVPLLSVFALSFFKWG